MREAGGSDNSSPSRGENSRGVVASDILREDPISGVRIEEGVEGYEVGLFAHAPGVVVFVWCGRWLRVVFSFDPVAFAGWGLWTPDGWLRADLCVVIT